jgi:hypothetical protein
VFVEGVQNSLKGVTNASSTQLQQAFSGTNCDSSALDAATVGGINIFLREPTSGTMNTTEATVFRGPDAHLSGGPNASLGLSQETGNLHNFNPLGDTHVGPCGGTHGGRRYRGIGTGEVVDGVFNSNLLSGFKAGQTSAFASQQDGLAYSFFSYGNVADIADKAGQYGYITLNGVDPIFSTYGPQLSGGGGYDPGQPATAADPGLIPGFVDQKALGGCSATNGFPCPEYAIWKGGYSFPNVRTGAYPAWSLLRLVTAATGGQKTAAAALLTKANNVNIAAIPDYIPFAATTCLSTSTPFPCATEIEDPGVLLVRAHYQQVDGDGNNIGAAAVENFTKTGTGGFAEAGGDMGGEVFICPSSTTCPNNATAGIVGTTHHYSPQSQSVLQGLGNQTTSSGGYAGGFQVRQ